MASRSEAKALKAIENLHEQNRTLKKGMIEFLSLDLASITSVVSAADEFKRRENKLDILGTDSPPQRSRCTTLTRHSQQWGSRPRAV
jgi:hypothetical protein